MNVEIHLFKSLSSVECCLLQLLVYVEALHAALYRSIYSLLTWSSLGTLQGFLGEFAKFQRATISFIMLDRLFICMEQHVSHWTDFHEFWFLSNLRNLSKLLKISLITDKNKGYFT